MQGGEQQECVKTAGLSRDFVGQHPQAKSRSPHHRIQERMPRPAPQSRTSPRRQLQSDTKRTEPILTLDTYRYFWACQSRSPSNGLLPRQVQAHVLCHMRPISMLPVMDVQARAQLPEPCGPAGSVGRAAQSPPIAAGEYALLENETQVQLDETIKSRMMEAA